MRIVATAFCVAILAASLSGDDSGRLLTIDHFVRVKSTVPAIAGQQAQLYVRERVLAGMVARGTTPSDRVVLFVHGAGTPAEVAFDVPHQDYSWMSYLASAGFDVFSVDMTGYGRSTRPTVMNDPCNLSNEEQTELVPAFLSAPCKPDYNKQLTTIASDHNDINAAVDYIRSLRRVERVNLIAWSLGGPRGGGYAAAHTEKISKLVVMETAYKRMTATNQPAAEPATGAAYNTKPNP